MKRQHIGRLLGLAAAILASFTGSANAATISGELKQWHKVTLSFEGSKADEGQEPNPFTDYRLDVTFEKDGASFRVPGYFAADGDAANSGATRGTCWRVHFCPPQPGEWTYQASFRTGKDVALSPDREAGQSAGHCDGETGKLKINASDKAGRDHRAKGRLQYVGEHYLRFAGDGEWFLKVGPDSPEGFLANPDIDGSTTGTRAKFSAHDKHWQSCNPTWAGGKGKNVVGAINYIADQQMNCFYLVLFSGHGDTRSVWPYRDVDDHLRFDCSKLDQWEILFEHMDRKGILLHMVLSETENESYWEVRDGGQFAPSRKLFYREMIARFAHHLALVWNLGEEIGWTDAKGKQYGAATSDAQRKAFCDHLRELDPYDSPIVAHTLPGAKSWQAIYEPLLGYRHFEGVSGQFSLQPNGMKTAHEIIKQWREASAKAGRKWIVSNDEPGADALPLKIDAKGNRADTAGVRPDVLDANHDYPRKWFLWASYMAGAAGTETYFGWDFTGHGGGDGEVNDYSAWANWWTQCRHAHAFFTQHVPLPDASPADELMSEGTAWCFAKRGHVYAVYLPDGGSAQIDLTATSGPFDVRWYDPRHGGPLQKGSVSRIQGGAKRSLGQPPRDEKGDWAVLIVKDEGTAGVPALRERVCLNDD